MNFDDFSKQESLRDSVVITDSKNEDFIYLIGLLDKDLNERNGELQKEYDQHNKFDNINNVVVIYMNSEPAGCGGFKELGARSVEIKRVYVAEGYRGQGLAKAIMNKLEQEAMSKGYKYSLLETGHKQYEAISLYKKLGYEIIPNYEPYVDKPYSICMRKKLDVKNLPSSMV